MKESLEHIVAWCKEHPYIAGAIGIVLIVVVWYTLKHQGSGSTGSASAEEPPAESPADQLGNAASSGADTTTSDQTSPGSSDSGAGGGGASGTGSGGNFDNLHNLDPAPDVTGSYAMSSGAPVSSASMDSMHYADMNVDQPKAEIGVASSGIKSVQASTLGKAAGGKADTKAVKKATVPNAQHTMSPYVYKSADQGHSSTQNKAPIGKASGGSSNKTPAMLAGKGRYYTGIYKGISYVLGYPVLNYQPALGSAGGGATKKK